jgi:UDP-3-O-acyl-N-acetylglucosamine deacetylase
VAHRGGHALHTEFAALVLEDVDAWTLVEAPAQPSVSAPAVVSVKSAAPAMN